MNDICKAYGQLASAVIMQAVQDYKETLNNLAKYPNDELLQWQKVREERFFHSEWFDILGSCIGIDGDFLLKRLQEVKSDDCKRVFQSDNGNT